MLSRVAENLYWISRYVERAENVARLLDVGFHLELDASDVTRQEGDLGPIESVLIILACRDAFEAAHGAPAGSTEKDREAVLRFLTFDRRHTNSIISMLARARENARTSQETLSGEIWTHINTFYLYLGGKRAQRQVRRQPVAVLRRDQARVHPLRRHGRRHPARGTPSTTSSSSAATWSGSTRSAGS